MQSTSNEAIIIPDVPQMPDVTKGIVELQAKAILAERQATSCTIADDEERDMALNALQRMKQVAKEVEALRDATVRPFNTLVDTINNIFRPLKDRFSSAETTYKKKIGDYAAEKERIRRVEEARQQEEYRKKLEEEAKKTDVEKEYVPPPVVTLPERQVKTETATGSVVRAWDFEVVDMDAFYKFRPDLCNLEIKKGATKSFVQALGKANQLDKAPGLRIFEVQDVKVRTRATI